MPPTKFETFQSLHHNDLPLMLNNVWDAASAAIASANGSKAIATSSAAIAWSLGYADGSHLPIEELVNAVRRIIRVTSLPVSIDLEDGYSDQMKDVCDLVERLKALGIAGINIEDGTKPPALLTDKIMAIRDHIGSDLFINARTDTYLQQLVMPSDALSTTIERMQAYQDAGANGGFVPGLLDTAAWDTLTAEFEMPMNAMITSHEYNVSPLHVAGVKRFSTGPFPFIAAYSEINIGAESLSFEQINSLF